MLMTIIYTIFLLSFAWVISIRCIVWLENFCGDSIFADFLWKGCGKGKSGHLIKWDVVCLRKDEGGLGIKIPAHMNEAKVLNQLWSLETNQRNQWNEWMSAYWTKGRSWWEDGEFSNCSWVLTRRMLECRRLSSQCAAVIDNSLRWIGTGKGFSVTDTYNKLRLPQPKVEWSNLIWGNFILPRDSLNAWLVAWCRLSTKLRQKNMGLNISEECIPCHNDSESGEHLFFQCQASAAILDLVTGFLKVSSVPKKWHLLIPWFNGLNRSRLRSKLLAVGICKTVSEIWKIFRNF